MLSSQAVQKISKDLLQLRKNPIDGIEILDPDSLTEIHAIIHAPNSTPFEDGQFLIQLQFGSEFPQSPPKGFFLTKIFHPNIDAKTGEICVNTLKRDWNSALGLKHILMVIRCLMIEPNPDSALNAEAGHLIQENFDLFVSKARMFTQIHAQKARASNNVSQVPDAQRKKVASFPTETVQNPDAKENNRNSSNTSSLASSQSASFKNSKTANSPVSSKPGASSVAVKKVSKKNKKKRGLRRL